MIVCLLAVCHLGKCKFRMAIPRKRATRTTHNSRFLLFFAKKLKSDVDNYWIQSNICIGLKHGNEPPMVNPPPIGGSFRFSFGLSARHVRKDQMHILFISAAMGKLRCLRLEEPRRGRILFMPSAIALPFCIITQGTLAGNVHERRNLIAPIERSLV